MSELYAAVLKLSRSDVKALKITDAYSLHRVVYNLFEDIRTPEQKQGSLPSGILYADKGGNFHNRLILILANRLPSPHPLYGEIDSRPISPDFLQHPRYAFEVVINPGQRDKQTGNIRAVRGRTEVAEWFISRTESSWGFQVNPVNLQVDRLAVQSFKKAGQLITHGSATLKGELRVTDPEKFTRSFSQGIGRGRAFGFGLLQIVPLQYFSS